MSQEVILIRLSAVVSERPICVVSERDNHTLANAPFFMAPIRNSDIYEIFISLALRYLINCKDIKYSAFQKIHSK